MLKKNPAASPYRTALIGFCVFASLSAALMFGWAWFQSGPMVSVAQIGAASDAYPWVKAVFWDITLFNLFVFGWFFYREEYLSRAVLCSIAFWMVGSVFLGLYVATLMFNTGCFQSVRLGRHLSRNGRGGRAVTGEEG
ncbi:MAG: hypothetical protein CVT79_04965 [Alphaproteobacteria bacterium HGW-Alphaproteobacteria-18]|nr:MAG: hypothetical protein CVT79_04965 [Alphaproteobacteria bacterium HGW-Alphaproteobacteria-18]